MWKTRKRSYTLRWWSRLCSLARSIAGLWLSWCRFASDLRLCIRPLRARYLWLSFLCLLPLLLSFGINTVHAQDPDPDPDPEPTATQTPDWVPLFSTPTPEPTKNYACPEDGEIEGWLTVTPSGEWLYRCSECIPRPTSSFWATKTPIPIDGTKFPTLAAQATATAAAVTDTPEPSPTPTVGPKGYTRQWGWSEISCPLGYCPRELLGNIVTVEERENLVATMWVYTVDMINNYYWTVSFTGIHLNGDDLLYRLHPEPDGESRLVVSGCRIVYQLKDRNKPVKAYIDELAEQYGCSKVEQLDGKPEAVPQSYQASFGLTGAEKKYAVNNKYAAIGIYWGIEPEEPTPTPPPSECDAVNGRDGSIIGGYKEDWLILPKMMQRSAGCTQIGGWSISTGWVGNITELVGITVPEVLQIPGLNICWQEIQFGEVDLFRIKISLDVIAGLMAGIAMIRIFR